MDRQPDWALKACEIANEALRDIRRGANPIKSVPGHMTREQIWDRANRANEEIIALMIESLNHVCEGANDNG